MTDPYQLPPGKWHTFKAITSFGELLVGGRTAYYAREKASGLFSIYCGRYVAPQGIRMLYLHTGGLDERKTIVATAARELLEKHAPWMFSPCT